MVRKHREPLKLGIARGHVHGTILSDVRKALHYLCNFSGNLKLRPNPLTT